MEYRFFLKGLEPLSSNNSHYGAKAGYSKKPKTRNWEQRLKRGMLKYNHHVESIKSEFIRDSHVLTRQYIFFFPKDKYWTKKGELSLHTQDVSNIAKIPDDIVMNVVLGIDDKFIQRGNVELIPWDKHYNGCLLIIKIENKDDLNLRASKWIEIAEAS